MIMVIFSGCQLKAKSAYNKYSGNFFDTFNTLTTVVGYTKSEKEFTSYLDKIQKQFERLHKLYDIYGNYDGINNIKTINDNAGIKPVKVDKEIIDLIIFSKKWYKRADGKTNIAMGSVLKIWHDYREAGKGDLDHAKLPPMEQLQDANKHTDIDKVIVDTKNSTVYLADKNMNLDVGAIAKGYATELVANEIMAEGLTSGIINAGGNVRVLGKPVDGLRERWGIGIQNPSKAIVSDDDTNLDTVFVNNSSVVSSGDYERYYTVNGKKYHHLIDPNTLMPATYYHAITIITKDSGIADYLSTAAFLMPYEESRKLIDSIKGIDAIWIMPDGKVEATEGARKIMKSNGATGTKLN